MAQDLNSRLSSAMVPIGRPVRDTAPRPLADLTADIKQAWLLRQRAQYEALGNLLVTLITDVDQAVLPGDAGQQQALTLTVHTYNAASSLLKRLGDSTLALQAADRALRAARALDDPQLIAAAAYRLANVYLAADRLADAQSAALQAAHVVEPGQMQTARSLSLWGGLLLTVAVAAARDQDESGAWEAMGEARAAARQLGADHSDVYAIFGPTNVAIHGVQVATELGDGRGAVQRGQHVQADGLPVSLLERRAQFLVDLAHGYALDGDHTQAVTALVRAERTAPQEVRLNQQVHALADHLSHQKLGRPTELRQLMHRLGLDR